MSEQLTKLAHKIDFQSEDKSQKTTEDDEEEEEKELVTFQPSLWPWDSVRTKLR
jgi:mediator of RNA polymerase II transcription subunit 17